MFQRHFWFSSTSHDLCSMLFPDFNFDSDAFEHLNLLNTLKSQNTFILCVLNISLFLKKNRTEQNSEKLLHLRNVF